MNTLSQKQITTSNLINILIFVFAGLYTSVFAQETSSTGVNNTLEDLHSYTAAIYGSNDVVVNGRKYLPEHYNAKGDPYFATDSWTEGSLIIDGIKYNKQEILYNIDIEKVILRTAIVDSTSIFLVLNNEFIEAFYIGQRHFINAGSIGKDFPGYVEVLYNGSFLVFSRHQKSFVSEYNRSTPNGFYSGTKSEHFILYLGQLDKLSSKNSLLNYFAEHQKEIKAFMRKQKIKYKKADYSQLKKLFEYCDTISKK